MPESLGFPEDLDELASNSPEMTFNTIVWVDESLLFGDTSLDSETPFQDLVESVFFGPDKGDNLGLPTSN